MNSIYYDCFVSWWSLPHTCGKHIFSCQLLRDLSSRICRPHGYVDIPLKFNQRSQSWKVIWFHWVWLLPNDEYLWKNSLFLCTSHHEKKAENLLFLEDPSCVLSYGNAISCSAIMKRSTILTDLSLKIRRNTSYEARFIFCFIYRSGYIHTWDVNK